MALVDQRAEMAGLPTLDLAVEQEDNEKPNTTRW